MLCIACRARARSPGASCADGRQHLALQRALPLSRGDIFQHGIVEHLLCQQTLQLGVLVLQSLQLPGVRDVQPAELGLPFVERRRTDPVFPANIGGRNTALMLLQDRPSQRCFASPAGQGMICSSLNLDLFIIRLLSLGRILHQTGGGNGAQVTLFGGKYTVFGF